MIPGVISELGDPINATAEQITVSSTAIPLTTIPVQANAAFITVEGAAIRWWPDGSTPTASVGHAQAVATSFTLYGGAAVRKAKFIRSTGSDGTINVSYYAGV